MLLHSERPKLHRVLAVLSAIGLNDVIYFQMYGLTWLIDLPSLIDDIDILILLTSAICHDLDHPGYNNAYQVTIETVCM